MKKKTLAQLFAFLLLEIMIWGSSLGTYFYLNLILLSIPFIFFAYEDKSKSWRYWCILICVGFTAYLIQFASAQTGWIYGNIHYGKSLGSGWRSIPFLAGFLWLQIVYISSHIRPGRNIKARTQALISSCLVTIYFFMMQPLAQKFHFWYWQNNSTPFQFYAVIGVFSFLFLYILTLNQRTANRPIALYFYLGQLSVYGIMHLI